MLKMKKALVQLLPLTIYGNKFVRHVSYKVLVAGGGSGGISVASKFKHLNSNELAVIEPSDTHYYQPFWTLVGGGIKSLSDSAKPMSQVIPKNSTWIKQKIVSFQPEENAVTLSDGSKVNYDYLVVALGISLDFNQIKGLPEALNTDGVCSNYSALTVEKTWKELQKFKGGNAIFTFPATPIKCAGAPQKIAYLADHHFRKTGVRDVTKISYNSALGVIFGVPKYAESLKEVAARKDIQVNLRHNLIEVDSTNHRAIFKHLDSGEKIPFQYDFLHVTPPQKAPECLKSLADASGFVDVNKHTLQHVKYENIFSLGDCSNLPTSKTAAAVASECGVLYSNIRSVMDHKRPQSQYQGYTSCPLVTGNSRCILAEFDYDLKPRETFPFDQSKERWLSYFVKKDVLPFIYWQMMMKGYWSGPGWFRKLRSFGFKN